MEYAFRRTTITARIVQDAITETITLEQRRFRHVAAGGQRKLAGETGLIEHESAQGQTRRRTRGREILIEKMLNPAVDRRIALHHLPRHLAVAGKYGISQ